MFADDGSVPNNPRLPFVIYRRVIDLIGSPDPERVIESVFRSHGWGDMWRNGIFPYVHYHSMIHEGMGIARGRAKVRFGGNKGREVELSQGDVCVLPAGTGHQCLWASPDLMVIGAYPQDRQLRPLPRQQGRARQGAANHPAGAAARLRSGVRQAGSAAAALATLACTAYARRARMPCPRRTGSNSGIPSTRSTSMPATRPRTSGASPRTSAAMRRRAASCSTTAAARRCRPTGSRSRWRG